MLAEGPMSRERIFPAKEDETILCLIAENSVDDSSRDDSESNRNKVLRVGNCCTNSLKANRIFFHHGIEKE